MSGTLRIFKADLFRALANPTRIAIVEMLRDEGEISVGRIHDALGIEQANASQHLSVLRAHSMVVARKAGNQVFYSLRDKRLGKVLDLLKEYFESHIRRCIDEYRGVIPTQAGERVK